MKTLIAQIYEQGKFHDVAHKQKRGLREAFARRGATMDWDYLADPAEYRYNILLTRLDDFKPDLVFTQFHAADVITAEQMRMLRYAYPDVTWVNWSGDSWAWSLTAPAMLELARQFDLWLVCAPDTLPVYAEQGINAKFWQIAYEHPLTPLPDMPTYDVVFLGNVISEPRRRLLEWLRDQRDYTVGIYGDWSEADGHNTYAFDEGEALYQAAAIAIADCAYPDQRNYISNRPFHIGGAGGALLLHQHVERMDILSGMVAGEHYVEWNTLDDLSGTIRGWLQPERAEERTRIVQAAREFVLRWHTWERRVEQLLQWVEELQGVRA